MIPLILGAAPMQDAVRAFVFPDRPGLESVHLCGSFNGWRIGADPLVKAGSVWRLERSLPAGRHEYKFVLNGSDWVLDPGHSRTIQDGSGNVNSLIEVQPDGFELPARRGDGRITASAFAHGPEADLALGSGRAAIRFRARRGDLESASVDLNGRRHALRPLPEGPYEWWSADVPAPDAGAPRWFFRVQDGRSRAVFSRAGLRAAGASAWTAPARPGLLAPTAAPGRIVYQIFPDRFADGSASNNPSGALAWDAAPTWFSFHGGDLRGVSERAGYLQRLGVQTIYFTPIFQSPANHRYETDSYTLVDRRLGTNAEFAGLVRSLKLKGIGVVLDGVFNHTSTSFFTFRSLRKDGEASRYCDWHFAKSFPIRIEGPPNYEAWSGFGAMPKLNVESPEVRQHLFDAIRYWHDLAPIQGWRLDVANELPMGFLRSLRRELKAIDPQAWIIGEEWGDARPWLKGDQWDSAMGYQFRSATVEWLAQGRTSGREWLEKMSAILHSYSPDARMNLVNLIGSHDTPRFLTLACGDQRRLLAALTLLLTWPGSPMIYYGDEIGMEGGPDPANRKGMEWGRAEDSNPVLAHVRRLAAIGGPGSLDFRRSPRLDLLDGPDSVAAYRRGDALVFVNGGVQAAAAPLPAGRWLDAMTGRALPAGKTISLPPLSSRVLAPAEKAALLPVENTRE